MKLRILGIAMTLFMVTAVHAQTLERPQSIHQEEQEYYKSLGKDGLYYEEHNVVAPRPVYEKTDCELDKVVFGWHPYWMNGKEANYRWDLLTELSYFSYEVNVNTGYAITTNNFESASVVSTAINNGVNVSLCATLFSNHSTFLDNATARQNFITTVIQLLQNRGAKGINLDFENMAAAHKAPFTSFVIQLSDALKSAIPGATLSLAMNAVEWSDIFDVAAMNPYVDYFCIMGYDYYYGGSGNAGPTDPLYHFGSTYDFNLSKSVTHYLNKGAQIEKLILALPYYGRAWPVQNYNVPAATTGAGSSATYAAFRDNANGYFSNPNNRGDSRSTYYNYTVSGSPRQFFISNEANMRERFDFVRKRGIGGMGMWALGNDDGYSDLWNGIQDYMTSCYVDPCEASLYDIGGGPEKNYYPNENYTYTVSPQNASSVTINFEQMDIEENYDYLYIYDGNSTSSPQVQGSPFSGTAVPSAITTSTGSFTLRFTSDGATQKAGYKLNYSCNMVPLDDPITAVEDDNSWKTEGFEQGFEDSAPNSTIKKAYYNVADYNGTEWRSNQANGFLTDYFDNALSNEWTIKNGTWANNNYLNQADEADGNTNIYTSLTQNLSNSYIYSWDAKIGGSGTNRRAGIHIFSDNPTEENRGNSYMVYFRPDASLPTNQPNKEIQIYKSVNGTLTLEHQSDFDLNANEWYNYKVIYDRITGELLVYVNDQLASSWTDSSPISNGTHVSFRSGNCTYAIDNFEVFRSRYPNVNITVGAASTNDIRYQNPSPTQPSGMISSIVTNTNQRIAEKDSVLLNIDWTAPDFLYLNDGGTPDLDTIYVSGIISASAFWDVNDPHSGIVGYEYAIGTTPGDNSIDGWNPVPGGASANSVVSNSMSFGLDVLYYFTIRALNGAGLVSEQSSDGFRLMLETLSIDEQEAPKLLVYPNPTREYLNIASEQIIENITIYDATGKLVLEDNSLTNKINVANLPNGNYTIVLKNGKVSYTLQWIKL